MQEYKVRLICIYINISELYIYYYITNLGYLMIVHHVSVFILIINNNHQLNIIKNNLDY